MFRILRKCSTRKLQMCPSPSSAVSPKTTATKNDALVAQSIDSPSCCPVPGNVASVSDSYAAGSMYQYGVRPSIRLSVPSIDRCSSVRRVCCCGYRDQEIAYRSIAARPAVSSNCEQRYAVSCRKNLNSDLLTAADCCRLHQPS